MEELVETVEVVQLEVLHTQVLLEGLVDRRVLEVMQT